jgi:uncharacterized protein (DUF1330 family)
MPSPLVAVASSLAAASLPSSRATGTRTGSLCSSSEDLETVKRWYDSPEYREVRRLREGAASLRVVAVEGL